MRTAALLALLASALPSLAQAPPRAAVEAKHGMVVCVSPPAAEIGVDVLKRGGNAVDAAVAVAFAQAVTWPAAGNIGGGGFMLVWPGNGKEPTFFDYRETAPATATADMFAKGVDYYSPKVAGVPGTVRGLALAHQTFGKLPWKDLVLPAVRLAEDGFPVDAALARSLNGVLASKKTANAEFRRVYGKNGGADTWQAGDKLVLPDLGRALRAVAEHGPDAFYTGDLAEKLEAEMKAGGGLITAADLAKYEAKVRKPARGTYRGYDVYSAPPPSSGGVALVEMLNVLETFDLKKHERYSPETVHLIAEAMRRAYCDRARYLGDPDFVTVPAHLTTKEYAKKLAAGIDRARATRSEELAPNIQLTDGGGETTHFSVADKDGICVANTYTLENAYGCRVVVRGAGYLLNNEMTDFNTKPGVTNRRGDIGTPANQIAPGKRMLSSMTPTILAKDGQPVLVTGSPGGRTIINTVLCHVVNFVDYGMGPQELVDAPRMHHQWFPDHLQHEDFPGFPDLAAKLKAMGHAITNRGRESGEPARPYRQGDGHTIVIDPKTGMYYGAADKRIDGKAAGY
jgi:gamma-glutamyltranspeptidase/glutathione hydrolase